MQRPILSLQRQFVGEVFRVETLWWLCLDTLLLMECHWLTLGISGTCLTPCDLKRCHMTDSEIYRGRHFGCVCSEWPFTN